MTPRSIVRWLGSCALGSGAVVDSGDRVGVGERESTWGIRGEFAATIWLLRRGGPGGASRGVPFGLSGGHEVGPLAQVVRARS